MKDMKAHLDKLAELALDCAELANRAAEKDKRDLFARLAKHYSTLAGYVEATINGTQENSGTEAPPAKADELQPDRRREVVRMAEAKIRKKPPC